MPFPFMQPTPKGNKRMCKFVVCQLHTPHKVSKLCFENETETEIERMYLVPSSHISPSIIMTWRMVVKWLGLKMFEKNEAKRTVWNF